jgi:hypothetical protein
MTLYFAAVMRWQPLLSELAAPTSSSSPLVDITADSLLRFKPAAAADAEALMRVSTTIFVAMVLTASLDFAEPLWFGGRLFAFTRPQQFTLAQQT